MIELGMLAGIAVLAIVGAAIGMSKGLKDCNCGYHANHGGSWVCGARRKVEHG